MKTLALLFFAASLLLADTVNMGFIGPSTSINDGTDYVGSYDLTIDGTPVLGVCITWDMRVGPPYAWTADLLPVSTFSPTEQVALLESDWLALQFTPTNESQWAAIHHAIWDEFGASYTDAGPWLALAAENYGLIDPTSFQVAVPTPDATQSFLIQTPEPGEWPVLLGLMLAVFGYILWHHRRREK